MSHAAVPERVRHLILEAIDSVAELEALLLLRETTGQVWTPETLGARLYVSRTVAAHVLHVLSQRRLLRALSVGYLYEPATPALAEDVTALAAAYSRSLIAVTKLIHGKPASSVQDFARAFRLRKDP